MKHKSAPPTRYSCEIETTEGLEFVSAAELRERFADSVHVLQSRKPGEVPFRYTGTLRRLLNLQTAQAVYLAQRYDVPRPRGLLGDAHFRRLIVQIETVRALSPQDTFQTFSIAAAGSDSSVMNRIKAE